MEKLYKKEEKGITLVALIITIIILIILAAVTLRAVFKNRMIDVAIEGVENYTKAQYEEADKFEDLSEELDEIVDNIGKAGVRLNNVADEESDKIKVEGVVEGSTKGISKYTFQKSLTENEEDFETEGVIESTDKVCTYAYKTLEKGKINYLRVIVTYGKGRTKTSNILKLCVTELCEGPFDQPVECETCNRKPERSHGGSHTAKGWLSYNKTGNGTRYCEKCRRTHAGDLYDALAGCSNCSQTSWLKLTHQESNLGYNCLHSFWTIPGDCPGKMKTCPTCLGEKQCTHGSNEAHYRCEHDEVCDFTSHVIE